MGGLTKSDLIKSKTGKVVSKKASAAGKKAYGSIKAWTQAVQKARKDLGLKGFVAVKGLRAVQGGQDHLQRVSGAPTLDATATVATLRSRAACTAHSFSRVRGHSRSCLECVRVRSVKGFA